MFSSSHDRLHTSAYSSVLAYAPTSLRIDEEFIRKFELLITTRDSCTAHRLFVKKGIPSMLVRFNNGDKRNELITQYRVKEIVTGEFWRSVSTDKKMQDI